MLSRDDLTEIAKAAIGKVEAKSHEIEDRVFIRRVYSLIERELNRRGYHHEDGYHLSVGLMAFGKVGVSFWHRVRPEERVDVSV